MLHVFSLARKCAYLNEWAINMQIARSISDRLTDLFTQREKRWDFSLKELFL